MGTSARDDPAIRLHRALNDLRAVTKSQGTAEAGTVIAGTLGTSSAALGMARLLQLYVDTTDQLRNLPETHTPDAYLAQLLPLEGWLSGVNLTQRWDSQINGLDSRAHDALRLCSDQLQLVRPLREVDQEELARWATEARRLLEEILDADGLDPRFRQFLAAALRDLIAAIDDYRLVGSAGLADIIARTVGTYGVERPPASTQEEKSFLTRLAHVCSNLLIVMTTATTMMELPANLQDSFNRLTESGIDEMKAIGSATPALGPGEVESEPTEP